MGVFNEKKFKPSFFTAAYAAGRLYDSEMTNTKRCGPSGWRCCAYVSLFLCWDFRDFPIRRTFHLCLFEMKTCSSRIFILQ